MSLSKQQLDFFHENGYVGPFTLFPETDAHKYSNVVSDKKLSEKVVKMPDILLANRSSPLKCFNMHLHSNMVYSLASAPTILSKIEQLIGANFLLWRTIFWGKPQNCCIVPWHKDIFDGVGYGLIKNVSCWLALSEVTEYSGCLEFICGSHKENLTQKDIYKDEVFTEKSASADSLLPPQGLEERVVRQPLKMGEFVIFDQRTLHGSGPNSSHSLRKGLVMRYAPSNIEKNLKVPCIIMGGSNANCCQKLVLPPSKSIVAKWLRRYIYRKNS